MIMNKIVIIHGSEWELEDIQEDVDWCSKQPWTLKRYTKEKDHAHCSVCWWTIAVSENPDIGEAFWTEHGNRWLCKECHQRFMNLRHNQPSQPIAGKPGSS
jgi:hypothetical protein